MATPYLLITFNFHFFSFGSSSHRYPGRNTHVLSYSGLIFNVVI